jgi:rhamnosyltransferase subunit B
MHPSSIPRLEEEDVSDQAKFILVPLGSRGDVYPFLWLGATLASRGHDVRVLTNPPFADAVRAAGLHPVVYGSMDQYEAILRDPDLHHPRRGFSLIARHSEALAREMIPRIQAEHAPGRSLLMGAGIAFGARIAAEAFQIPLVTLQLQPAVFLSVEDPPVVRARTEWIRGAPRWVVRSLYALGYLQTDRLLAAWMNRLRRELGLRNPVRRILRDYWMSPLRVLALFPEWFALKQADWPPQTIVTRFPLYDEGDRMPLDPELEAFLAAGEPPVLFTPGSANVQAASFFRVAAEVCARLQRRALFATPHAEQVPPGLPASIRHVQSVPFSRVFPRCAAVVHHGGIGTVAQGLAAGVPQLVMAMSHDQPDNGNRLRRMGVGDYLYPRAFRAAMVTARLERLLTSAEVARACGRYRDLMARQMSTADVARLIEACHPGTPSPRVAREPASRDPSGSA